MSRTTDAVHRFIDLEAEVDDDTSESGSEEEDTEPDTFIDDRAHHSNEAISPRHIYWRTLSDQEEGLNTLLAGILDRSRSSTRRTPVSGNIVRDVDDTQLFGRCPRQDDYPLWRVRCRLGVEEEAVFFLLQKAAPQHQLRSVFERGSVRGWVYLETTMNEHMKYLLRLVPGIVHRQIGVAAEQIDFGDWTKMLTLRDSATHLEVGIWVWVCKGTYKGDVGYVSAVENWGGVSVLLVPRLAPPPLPGTSLAKRKRSRTPPEPQLFDSVNFKHAYGRDPVPVEQTDGCYTCNGVRFEHGLIVKVFDAHSVSSTSVHIPTNLFFLFQRSRHPLLLASKFPQPVEWNFTEGERVVVVSSRKQGIIKAIGVNAIEVEFCNGEGIMNVPWSDLRKHLVSGDFVEVTSGLYRGQIGWVEDTTDETVSILSVEKLDNVPELPDVKRFEVHVNWLKISSVPYQLVPQPSTQSDSASSMWSDPVPWIETTVIISRVGHPLKGYRGTIKSVLCEQPSSSGLRVGVQLSHLAVACPFKIVTLDYDDVVEAIGGRKLFEFRKPKGKQFKPRNYKPSVRTEPRLLLPSSPGNATPMPDWSPSSTPAWNPSSHTPLASRDDYWTHRASPPLEPDTRTPLPGPSHDILKPSIQHLLLDSRLLGIQLKVVVTGGKFREKEMLASLALVDGQLSLRHKAYNTSQFLSPDWVSPKHPNPTRDNGLLVVIKGEHCGKHVRRIHHQYENGDPIILLAVVKKNEDAANTLTGEQLQLDPGHLCIGAETKEEKRHNESLMTTFREAHRTIGRAK